LLIEAQGGEDKAKYGNALIKEYSEKLTNEIGRGYTFSALSRMRQFYLLSEKIATLSQQLTWSHYCELLTFDNVDEINYYIKQTGDYNLSVRELREKIKSKEYQR
jgi:predicted nuclease of restriction endonuclease-like (RecB) superfamily